MDENLDTYILLEGNIHELRGIRDRVMAFIESEHVSGAKERLRRSWLGSM